mmetsp:Transcript_62586/g.183011  ORF Transcript_62586/g.183011 Transcript_62586/m.183011 type:complete len:211 (-) Transcript_62586:882-1514(-)
MAQTCTVCTIAMARTIALAVAMSSAFTRHLQRCKTTSILLLINGPVHDGFLCVNKIRTCLTAVITSALTPTSKTISMPRTVIGTPLTLAAGAEERGIAKAPTGQAHSTARAVIWAPLAVAVLSTPAIEAEASTSSDVADAVAAAVLTAHCIDLPLRHRGTTGIKAARGSGCRQPRAVAPSLAVCSRRGRLGPLQQARVNGSARLCKLMPW